MIENVIHNAIIVCETAILKEVKITEDGNSRSAWDNITQLDNGNIQSKYCNADSINKRRQYDRRLS